MICPVILFRKLKKYLNHLLHKMYDEFTVYYADFVAKKKKSLNLVPEFYFWCFKKPFKWMDIFYNFNFLTLFRLVPQLIFMLTVSRIKMVYLTPLAILPGLLLRVFDCNFFCFFVENNENLIHYFFFILDFFISLCKCCNLTFIDLLGVNLKELIHFMLTISNENNSAFILETKKCYLDPSLYNKVPNVDEVSTSNSLVQNWELEKEKDGQQTKKNTKQLLVIFLTFVCFTVCTVYTQ